MKAKSKVDELIEQLDTFKIPKRFLEVAQDLKGCFGIDVKAEIRYIIENENKNKI